MKKCFALLLAVLTIFGLMACSPASEETTDPSPSVQTPSPSPEDTPSAVPTPAPENLSPTTGLEGKTAATYTPITVMIENSPAARPQTGMQQADIVYEALAEGGITRFMCLFNDQKPTMVGPVRSVRIYYLNMQKEWDSLMVHYGGVTYDKGGVYTYGPDTDYIKVRVDGIAGKWEKYFWRSSGRKAPHNVYTDLTKVQDELYDFTPDQRAALFFSADAAGTGQTVDVVRLPFLSNDSKFVSFQYDAAADKFVRYQQGKPFDVVTVSKNEAGEQTSATAPLTFQNLIIQYAKTYVAPGDPSGRRLIDLTGEGSCEYFIGGKRETGTWKRASLDEDTQYLDSKGNPIVLRPGNTYIGLHPTAKQAEVVYA